MRILKLLAVCVSLSTPVAAGAVPITFDFTGTATIASGIWSGQGTAVSGSYTYDTDLTPTLNSAITNTFLSNNAANAGLGYNLTIQLGTTTFSVDETDGLFNFGLFDKATDQYSFVGAGANLVLFGSDAAAISNLDGSVPTSAPDLSLFQSPASAGRVGTQLKFSVNSIVVRPSSSGSGGSVGAVPEPGAALLFGLGICLAGRGAARRRQLG
jgi:hypothetical protein